MDQLGGPAFPGIGADRRGDARGAIASAWWRHGWLIDRTGSAVWSPEPAPGRAAQALARTHAGAVVRLRALPEGYRRRGDRGRDGLEIPLDTGGRGVEAVVVEAADGDLPLGGRATLIGPVASVVAAERRACPGPAGGPGREARIRRAGDRGRDPVPARAWSGAVVGCAGAWAAIAVLAERLLA